MSKGARRNIRKPTTSTRRLVAAMTGKGKPRIQSTPTIVDGIRFHSKKEARRYCELKLLERAGKISCLRRQVRFALVQRVTYVADFEYVDECGARVVEDVKGYRTREYVAKRRLMSEQHGIEIRET